MSSSLVFNGFDFTAASSPRGGRFRTLSLEGWIGLQNRRDRTDKMQQAGAWESTGFPSSLPIMASGTAVYADATSAALERRELLALAGGERYEMTVVDALGEGTRIVECDSLNATPVRDAMFSWSFAVTACDPLLYGPTAFASTTLSSSAGGAGLTYPLTYLLDYGVAPGVTPGAITVANGGTASYFPRLRIDGPVTNPVVTVAETGDQVRFRGSVAAGQWLDIIPALRRVLLNGLVSQRNVVSFTGRGLGIPVGGGSVTWTADTADPAASLSCWSYEGAWS